MNMKDLKEMAKKSGAKIGKATVAEAIRLIQQAEGNFDCYGRAVSGYCDQEECLFKESCLTYSTTGPGTP